MPSSDNRGWPQGARSKGRPPQLPQPTAAFSETALLRAKLRGLFFPYQLSCLYFGQTCLYPTQHEYERCKVARRDFSTACQQMIAFVPGTNEEKHSAPRRRKDCFLI